MTSNNSRKSLQKLIFKSTFVLCIISLILSLVCFYLYKKEKIWLVNQIREKAKTQAENAVVEIDKDFQKIEKMSTSIVTEFSTGKLNETLLRKKMEEIITKNRDIHQIGMAYKPYALTKDKRLHSFMYSRKTGVVKLYPDTMYDYTKKDITDKSQPRTHWYHRPLQEGAVWLDPYFATGVKSMIAEYTAPLTGIHASTQKKEKISVFYCNFSLFKIRDLVGKLDIEDSAYGFIMTAQGTIISHPISEYLGKNISELDDKNLKEFFNNKKSKGKNKPLIYTNQRTGQISRVFSISIPSTGWVMGVVLPNLELSGQYGNMVRRLLIIILITFLAFLFFLSILVLRAYLGDEWRLWGVATFDVILCIVGILFIWSLAIKVDDYDHNNIKIYENAAAQSVLHKKLILQQNTNNPFTNPPIIIPTGVFIQSINFTGANNVIMTGYIWQKFTPEMKEKISPGIILPEAEEVEIEESYRTKNSQGDEIIGWHFKATLRQQFNYSHYPFDREDVWLRLWPKDFSPNVFLVPDFVSYNSMIPQKKPGMEQNFVLEGWKITNSFFSYRLVHYNTNFGDPLKSAGRAIPELHYNVDITRNFLSPFISYMIPIFVVAFLVFGVLITATKHEKKLNIMGFSASSVLAYCAALFFVLTVSHVHLRETLAAEGIIYLEYFYFVMYVVTLAISVNSIMFSTDRNIWFIHYKDNLLAKILYWPLTLNILFVVTIIVFY